MKYTGILIRFIVSVIVLQIAGALHWGVKVAGFRGSFAAAFIITLLTFVVERVAGAGRTGLGRRRVMGYVTSAIVVYLTQFFLTGLFSVSILGALFTAIFIGLADTMIPALLK